MYRFNLLTILKKVFSLYLKLFSTLLFWVLSIQMKAVKKETKSNNKKVSSEKLEISM